MKKSKLTLGFVAAMLGLAGLTSCNEVTYSDGVVLEYKDAQGNTAVKITAAELFDEYNSTSVASTDFDKVYEVLIRKYYQSGSGVSSLPELKAEAEKAVRDIKDQADKNAKSNSTSYDEELSKLLSSNNCENINELYEAKLLAAEKSKFEKDYETTEMVEKMRDGNGVFTKSDEYGEGDDGYLVEQMPYTVSHILIKLGAASNGEHAQATISESESSKLGQVIELLAGAEVRGDGKTAANTRVDFGTIALQNSEDEGSAKKYGQLSVMDRDVADSFINEFKFGIYAYEAIYNQRNLSEVANPYAAKVTTHSNSGEAYNLLSKILYSEDATYTNKALAQSADEIADELAEGEHYIKNYFASTGAKIGVIPFGAAVALAREDVSKNQFTYDDGGVIKSMNWTVSGGSTFYPRNILFNKYFNNHRVAVIVPNEIPYNDNTINNLDGDYTTENFVGKLNEDFAALPGFQKDTSEFLTPAILGQNSNVLTTEKGQIILAVRGGSSGSYEGIHLMVIDRSALEEIVTINDDYSTTMVDMTLEDYNNSVLKESTNSNSLSEFYTIHRPTEAEFPTYSIPGGEVDKTTYVNQLHTTTSAYRDNVDTLTNKIKGYNPNKDTYMFQTLIEDDTITFADNFIAQKVKKDITEWISSKRHKSIIDSAESFDEAWATYIEYLTAQDAARSLNPDGSQRLISETCAIGYNKKSSDPNNNATLDDMWKTGGACYAK